ncbi:MAG: hypothetical protein IJR90_09475 [Clostridia bacterium]|nr:hypothetical protein [Clostridia bacterium]
MAFVKTYSAPPFDEKEALRYAGCAGEDADTRKLLDACVSEAAGVLSYKVCYLPVVPRSDGRRCKLGAFSAVSRDLSRLLDGCASAVIFAATVGVGIDRLIAKYGAVSPAKALMLDAVGTERVEALCGVFCRDISNELDMRPTARFSPGYGDLDLSVQKEIFSALNCQKLIGLTLTDSLLMSPSKSVTAVFGLRGEKGGGPSEKCAGCAGRECPFRGEK